MLAGYKQSAREDVFRNIFKRASHHFDKTEFDQSERLCHVLLSYPDLSDYHQAGCHRILSLGDTNFLWHAEQAVEIYERLFCLDDGEDASPYFNARQRHARDKILCFAHQNLAQARRDDAAIKADHLARVESFKALYHRDPLDDDEITPKTLHRHGKEYKTAIEAADDQEYKNYLHQIFNAKDQENDQRKQDDNNHDDKDTSKQDSKIYNTQESRSGGQGKADEKRTRRKEQEKSDSERHPAPRSRNADDDEAAPSLGCWSHWREKLFLAA